MLWVLYLFRLVVLRFQCEIVKHSFLGKAQAGDHSPLCPVASSQEARAGQQLGCDPPRPAAVPSAHGASHHEGKRLRLGERGGGWVGKSQGLAVVAVALGPAASIPGGRGVPNTSGGSVHLSSSVQEEHVTETQCVRGSEK